MNLLNFYEGVSNILENKGWLGELYIDELTEGL